MKFYLLVAGEATAVCERIIALDGSYDATAVETVALDGGTLGGMYESMVQARSLGERGLTLQRRGDFHFWMECAV